MQSQMSGRAWCVMASRGRAGCLREAFSRAVTAGDSPADLKARGGARLAAARPRLPIELGSMCPAPVLNAQLAAGLSVLCHRLAGALGLSEVSARQTTARLLDRRSVTMRGVGPRFV